MQESKVITLWQPFASLYAMKLKENETRGWPLSPKNFGEIYIHAAQKVVPFEDLFPEMTAEEKKILKEWIYEKYGSYENLPRGQIIAKTNIFDCQEVVPMPPAEKERVINKYGPAAKLKNGKLIYGPEYHFGDYTPGRHIWLGKDTEEIEPVTIKGQQGLWSWKRED